MKIREQKLFLAITEEAGKYQVGESYTTFRAELLSILSHLPRKEAEEAAGLYLLSEVVEKSLNDRAPFILAFRRLIKLTDAPLYHLAMRMAPKYYDIVC